MWRLFEFLFIKRTLNFLSIIIGYVICHWNCQLIFWNFKNLFRPPFSVSLIKRFFSLLFEHYHQSKILEPRSYHQILDINFSTLYFRFLTTSFLRWHFFATNESYYCTDPQGSMYINIFLVLLAEKYLNIFSLIVLLNLWITQDFSSFSVE